MQLGRREPKPSGTRWNVGCGNVSSAVPGKPNPGIEQHADWTLPRRGSMEDIVSEVGFGPDLRRSSDGDVLHVRRPPSSTVGTDDFPFISDMKGGIAGET